MNKNLYMLGMSLAGLGLITSLYLAAAKTNTVGLVCGFSSCDIVNISKYSYLFGIPVSFFGVFFYVAFLVLLYLKRFTLLWYLAIFGFGFSVYLTLVEAFIIKAFCQWCLLSFWITFCLFVIVFRLKKV